MQPDIQVLKSQRGMVSFEPLFEGRMEVHMGVKVRAGVDSMPWEKVMDARQFLAVLHVGSAERSAIWCRNFVQPQEITVK